MTSRVFAYFVMGRWPRICKGLCTHLTKWLTVWLAVDALLAILILS